MKRVYEHFSEMYAEAIVADENFVPALGSDLRKDLYGVIGEIYGTYRHRPNRYDDWTEDTSALEKTERIFLENCSEK